MYSYEDRIRAVELFIRLGKRAVATALAREFDISRPTFYNWKNQLLGCEVPALMKRLMTLRKI